MRSLLISLFLTGLLSNTKANKILEEDKLAMQVRNGSNFTRFYDFTSSALGRDTKRSLREGFI